MKKKSFIETEPLSVEKDLYLAHKGKKWLYKFQDVRNLPIGEPYDSIRLGYEQKDIKSRVWAMLVNGCISSGKKGFALSKTTMIHYFNSDPNIHISSIKGNVYSNIREFLANSTTFDIYEEGSDKMKKINGKFVPRIYTVRSEVVLKEIEKNIERLTKK